MIHSANSRSACLRSGAKNHTQQPNTPSRRPALQTRLAFTLVELLVVIAIITVLAALLLPTLSRGKASAKSAVCKSNLHQVGLALNLYVDDYKAYPVWIYDPPGHADVFLWWDFLFPYCGGNSNAFICPSVRFLGGWPQYRINVGGTEQFSEKATLGLGIYGSRNVPVPESRVLVPSDMIAVGHYHIYHDYLLGFGWPGGTWSDYGKSFHQGGDLAVFCDSHVESSKAERSGLKPTAYGGNPHWEFKPTEALAKRWNNDHQPHPETWPKP
jgi:prepilin-type N-terminal cleavage/methylation domain-containing protein